MRIVVVSPPKAGNHWLKCLLGEVYGLEWLHGSDKPKGRPAAYERWVERGQFPDGTVFHTHMRYTARFADAIASAPAHVVTILRDPYDLFVSLYHWVQERHARGLGRPGLRRDALAGRSLDDPAVLRYLAKDFGMVLDRGLGWLESGRSTVVRYEDLHRDGVAALRSVTDRIEPVDDARLRLALESCTAERMRTRRTKMQWHVRSAVTGEGARALGPAHLGVMRKHHARRIRRLGYAVR